MNVHPDTWRRARADMSGGEYFFLPSLSALRWLAHLRQP